MKKFRAQYLKDTSDIIIDENFDVASVKPMTILDLLERSSNEHPNQPALRYKKAESLEWNEITYKELRVRVQNIAKVFLKLGLERHGTVAVLASNSAEWVISGLAAIHAG